MIVYNVTTKVHLSIDGAWLQWLKDEHIPAVMAGGFFIAYQICRLLEQDDSEGYTYAVQYTASGEKDYQQFMTILAPELRKKATEKWGAFIISFHSALEVLH